MGITYLIKTNLYIYIILILYTIKKNWNQFIFHIILI